MSLDDLPLGFLKVEILSKLQVKDIIHFLSVNHRYQKIDKDNSFWKLLIVRDYGKLFITENNKGTYLKLSSHRYVARKAIDNVTEFKNLYTLEDDDYVLFKDILDDKDYQEIFDRCVDIRKNN